MSWRFSCTGCLLLAASSLVVLAVLSGVDPALPRRRHPYPSVECNIAGDDQADRSAHGGPDQAVYAYAREDLDWWSEGLGAPLPPGVFGENLTLAGVEVTEAVIGERKQVLPCQSVRHRGQNHNWNVASCFLGISKVNRILVGQQFPQTCIVVTRRLASGNLYCTCSHLNGGSTVSSQIQKPCRLSVSPIV